MDARNGRTIGQWFCHAIIVLSIFGCATLPEETLDACPPVEEEVPESGGTPDLALRPGVVPPAPSDPQAAVDLVQQHYPSELKDAGIGGEVLLSLRVDSSGDVIEVRMEEGSGLPRLDEAAVTVVEAIKFTPARRGECTVPVWVRMPVRFGNER